MNRRIVSILFIALFLVCKGAADASESEDIEVK